MERRFSLSEDKLRDFIWSSNQFLADEDRYIFLGALLKAFGPNGAEFIQDTLHISSQQLFEAEKKLDELRQTAEVQ